MFAVCGGHCFDEPAVILDKWREVYWIQTDGRNACMLALRRRNSSSVQVDLIAS